MSLFNPTFVVAPWERCLERAPGQPTRDLGPGEHRKVPRATYETVDVRERLDTVSPQEVPTADGVTVKVSAVIRSSVTDAVAFTERSTDPLGLVYLAVQVALREALVDLDLESAAAARRDLGPTLTTAAVAAGAGVGLLVHEVVVKDVILPAEVRAAQAELLTTKQRAQVQLEAARAETAALRSLANAAKLLDEQPALARLRLVQALPPGSTVDLTLDPS